MKGARAVAERLWDAGFEAWYVGGAVRDRVRLQLTGAASIYVGDQDITTTATPEQVQALFRRTIPVGIDHGTVVVLDDESRSFEVTTYRKDVMTDGRHAVVEFGVSLDEDLARRDFTINAMAEHPLTGEIRDPFGGRKDLEAGLIRTVGDATTRFREDRLRVLRGLRFAAVLNFQIDQATWDAMRAVAKSGALASLSKERVRDEWTKTLTYISTPSRAFAAWGAAGVWTDTWPEFEGLNWDTLQPLNALGNPNDSVLVTAVAMAAADQLPEVAAAAMRRLRFPNRDVARVRDLLVAWKDDLQVGDERSIRKWLVKHHHAMEDFVAVMPPDIRQPMKERLEAVKQTAVLSIHQLAINGNDLRAVGVPANKQLGTILKQLFDLVLEDPSLNTRETLLGLVTPHKETV